MLIELIIILIFGLLGGVIAKKLNQPAIIGYLVAGFIAALILPSSLVGSQGIQKVSELGVALLLFSLGLELNIHRINSVILIATLGGILQIILSIIIYRSILVFLGFGAVESLFIASGFSLSSTAVVIKLLSEKGMVGSLHGNIMVAWLLIQDIAVVPLLVILPLFQPGISSFSWWSVALPLAKILILLSLVLVLGKPAARLLLSFVTKLKSKELLLLTTITFCLAVALGTELIGFSFALGAFLAGIMIAESTEQHSVFSEIRPVRDIFVVLFFVSLPLIATYDHILSSLPIVLLLSLIVIVVKFLLVGILTFLFGYHSRVSFLVAVGLIQVGEFAFVLLREGLTHAVITPESYFLVLMVTMITIIFTPVAFTNAIYWYEFIRSSVKKRLPSVYESIFKQGIYSLTQPEVSITDHVVLCGYGRMGRYIGRALESENIPYVVIDYNRETIAGLLKDSVHALYGDCTSEDLLRIAGVVSAKLIVITSSDIQSQLLTITNARKLNKSIKSISRIHYAQDQTVLKSLGATYIIHPEFTASLAAVEKTLIFYNINRETIDNKLARLKIEHGMEQ